ncbi:MAG: hypothetical protein Q9168_007548 [Polycauliona sp. 1 TL-2023]
MAAKPNLSFRVGAKHESSDLTPTSTTSANPLNRYPHLKLGFFTDESTTSNNVKPAPTKTCKIVKPASAPIQSPAPQPETPALPTALPASARNTALRPSETIGPPSNPLDRRNPNMAEPPVKRAKRTDSAAMWEQIPSQTSDAIEEMMKYESMVVESVPEDRARARTQGREDEIEMWRGGEIAADEPPPRRPDRHRSRSRSPARDPKLSTRTRSPPRGTSSKPPPSGPSKQSGPSASPPPTKAPPKGPKSNNPPLPKTNGTTSTSAPPSAKPTAAPPMKMDIDEDSDPETAQMRRMMGFADFKTTKNTKVPGNDVYAVRKEKKTEYRQYMNRVGGFNRPLSPSR